MELAARLDQEVEVTLQLESPLLEMNKNWQNMNSPFLTESAHTNSW